MFYRFDKSKGFTLIELLVVISIIGLLSSVVLASVNTARSKARDSQRKQVLKQFATANELYFNTNSSYAPTAGWLTNWVPSNNALAPAYISTISRDPGGNGGVDYIYWRGDYNEPACTNPAINPADLNINNYYFYAKLENASTQDQATLSSNTMDQCLKNQWGMNYKVGN